MPNEQLRDQTVALAGLTQTSFLINHLALTGRAEDDGMQTMLKALFAIHPKSVDAVFGGAGAVSIGMRTLAKLLRVPPRGAKDQWSCIRYMLDMIAVSGELLRQPDMLEVLGARLPEIERQWREQESAGDGVYAQIDQLYRDTLSGLPHKIHISGRRDHITQPPVVHRIRSLLLCGVRAAVLWRQLGGRRAALLFRRRRMMRMAEHLS